MTPPKPTKLVRNLPPPPENLEPVEARMWSDLVSEFRFSDTASLGLLRGGYGKPPARPAHPYRIDKVGEAYTNRFGEPRKHPLLSSERESRQSFIQACGRCASTFPRRNRHESIAGRAMVTNSI